MEHVKDTPKLKSLGIDGNVDMAINCEWVSHLKDVIKYQLTGLRVPLIRPCTSIFLGQSTTSSLTSPRINRESRPSRYVSITSFHVTFPYLGHLSLSETHFWPIPGRNIATGHLRADRRRSPLPWTKDVQTRRTLCIRYRIFVPHGKVRSYIRSFFVSKANTLLK